MSKTHFTSPVEARGRMLGRQWRTYEGTWGRGAVTSEGGLGVSCSLSRPPNWESVNGGCGELVMWRVRCVQLCISSFLPKLDRRRGSIYKSGSKKNNKNTDTVLDELVLFPQTFLCVTGEHKSKGSVWMWKEKKKPTPVCVVLWQLFKCHYSIRAWLQQNWSDN